jgi:hypothetical protein
MDFLQQRPELGHIEAPAADPVDAGIAAGDLSAIRRPLQVEKPAGSFQIRERLRIAARRSNSRLDVI